MEVFKFEKDEYNIKSTIKAIGNYEKFDKRIYKYINDSK